MRHLSFGVHSAHVRTSNGEGVAKGRDAWGAWPAPRCALARLGLVTLVSSPGRVLVPAARIRICMQRIRSSCGFFKSAFVFHPLRAARCCSCCTAAARRCTAPPPLHGGGSAPGRGPPAPPPRPPRPSSRLDSVCLLRGGGTAAPGSLPPSSGPPQCVPALAPGRSRLLHRRSASTPRRTRQHPRQHPRQHRRQHHAVAGRARIAALRGHGRRATGKGTGRGGRVARATTASCRMMFCGERWIVAECSSVVCWIYRLFGLGGDGILAASCTCT